MRSEAAKREGVAPIKVAVLFVAGTLQALEVQPARNTKKAIHVEDEIREARKVTRDAHTNSALLLGMLTSCLRRELVVEVFRDRFSDRRLEGRVLGVSEDVVLLAQVGDSLSFDGLTAFRTADISRIRLSERTPTLRGSISQVRLDEVGLLEMTTAATRLEQDFGIIAFHLEEFGVVYVGRSVAVDDEFIHIKCTASVYDNGGYEVVVRHKDMTRIEAATEYLENLKGLSGREQN